MTIAKMTAIAAGFTAAGSVIGGLIGWAFGRFTPDFYRATLPGSTHYEGNAPDPVQIGIGFGIAQGLLMGFILGCVVLIASAIRAKKAHE